MKTTLQSGFAFLAGNAEEPTHLYLRCWMVPKHLKVPLTMMASRVQRASHSSILWKTTTVHCYLWLTQQHVSEQSIRIPVVWANVTLVSLVTLVPRFIRSPWQDGPQRLVSCYSCARVWRLGEYRRPTCVMWAPPLGRPGWRSWWHSRGSVESGDPSLSWARPAQTQTQTRELHSLLTAPDEHKPNPYLQRHTAKDLKRSDSTLSQPMCERRKARLDWTHMASHLDPVSLINPYIKRTSQSQMAITLCRSWIAEISIRKSLHIQKQECKSSVCFSFVLICFAFLCLAFHKKCSHS